MGVETGVGKGRGVAELVQVRDGQGLLHTVEEHPQGPGHGVVAQLHLVEAGDVTRSRGRAAVEVVRQPVRHDVQPAARLQEGPQGAVTPEGAGGGPGKPDPHPADEGGIHPRRHGDDLALILGGVDGNAGDPRHPGMGGVGDRAAAVDQRRGGGPRTAAGLRGGPPQGGADGPADAAVVEGVRGQAGGGDDLGGNGEVVQQQQPAGGEPPFPMGVEAGVMDLGQEADLVQVPHGQILLHSVEEHPHAVGGPLVTHLYLVESRHEARSRRGGAAEIMGQAVRPNAETAVRPEIGPDLPLVPEGLRLAG